jgi:predicted permease
MLVRFIRCRFTRWAQDLVQDLRYAIRTLAHQPGFAAVAILSAALGIGACSTIFGIGSFALFRSLPVTEPDRLVTLSGLRPKGAGISLSYPELLDLRTRPTLAAVAAFFPLVPANIGSAPDVQRHWGWIVTANYFDVLGLRPQLGRTFSVPQDDQPGGPPVVVLSHQLWRSRFGGDASLVGREIRFNGRQVTVIGVAPPGFRGHEVALVADFWIPMSMLDQIAFPKGGFQRLEQRDSGWLNSVARLAASTTLAQARADLAVLAGQLRAQFPGRYEDRGFHIERAGQINPYFRSVLLAFFTLLLVVALLVLLVACANVANLLLARSTSRRQEIATRLAIGAGRGRIVRQFLTESVLLAALGGIGGVALARWGVGLIGRFQLPIEFPLDLRIALDYRVVLFAAGLSIFTGVAFGLLPALQATKEPPARISRRRWRWRDAFVVVQVAVSAVLLIVSGLFLRSLSSAHQIDIGMRARQVLFVGVDTNLIGYSFDRTRVFMETLAARVAGLPGVQAVSYTNLLPLSFVTASGRFAPDDKRSEPPERRIHAQAVMIGPRFFQTLEIPFLRGQDFGSERPDGELVAIVNEEFARQAFPGQDPIGRRVYHGNDGYRIIGVVGTSKVRTIGEEPQAQVYQAVSQMIAKEDMPMGLTLAVKTAGEPSLWLPAVREQIASLDPSLAVYDVKTMRAHLRNALLLPRLAALLFGLAGGMGLLIAAIGLYGVVSFAVARRTKEIGIRLALGARRGEILAMVLRSSLLLSALGALIGVGLALAGARLAASLLYGVRPSDPLTYLAVPMFLIAVAGFSGLIPARRAARLDPIGTLRQE